MRLSATPALARAWAAARARFATDRPAVCEADGEQGGAAQAARHARRTPAQDRAPGMTRMRVLAPLLLAALGGCVAAGQAPRSAAAAAPVFDPVVFFAGATHGTGRLHIILHRTRSTDVAGVGFPDGKDAIVLRQRVSTDGATPTTREWRLRRTGPGTYAGTLTDATGPVAATVDGNVLTIRFAMKHGLAVVQHLYLQPGGTAALNTMVVRKWGVVVARLDERIERQP